MIMNLWLSPEIRSPYPGWVLDLIPVFNYSFQGGSNSCFFPHWILLGVFSLWGGWPLRSGWAFIAAQRTARSGSMRQLNRASAISGEKGGKLRKATRSWGGKRWDMVTWWKIMENGWNHGNKTYPNTWYWGPRFASTKVLLGVDMCWLKQFDSEAANGSKQLQRCHLPNATPNPQAPKGPLRHRWQSNGFALACRPREVSLGTRL